MGKSRLFVILAVAACSLLAANSWAIDKVLGQKWLVYANSLYAKHQYDQAISAYSTSLRADNTSADAYQGLGNCFYGKGDKASDLKYYQYSLQLKPSNTPLANFVGSLQASLGAPSATIASSSTVSTAGAGDWGTSAWHSAVCPGWGQFTNGESTKGWILGGLTWASLIGTVGTYMVGSQAKSTYEGLGAGLAQSAYDTPYNTWSSMATMNHVFYISFGLLYTYNIVDAIINAKAGSSVTSSLLQPNMEPPAVQLSLLPEGGFRMDYAMLKF